VRSRPPQKEAVSPAHDSPPENRQLAKREGISINQFIASATAEKMTALFTEEYLNKRAYRASQKKFQAVFDKVPDVEPENYDNL